MLRRSGKVCADELLEDLDQLHARNIQRGTARSSETPARAFRQQSVHGDVSESTDSEDEHHVVNPRVASKLPSRMKQPQQLDGKRFSQVDAKVCPNMVRAGYKS